MPQNKHIGTKDAARLTGLSTQENYDVVHIQSFDDMVQSMASYCRRKGEEL